MSTPAPAAASPQRGRRRPRTVVVTVLLLGAAVLVVATRTWVRAAAPGVLGPEVDVAVTGTSAAPGVSAAAVLLLAAGLALGLVRRLGRWLVALVVVGGAVIGGASAVGVLADPEGVARAAVSQETGVGVLSGDPVLTAGPLVAAALCGLAVVAGAWAALGRWDVGPGRYERPAHRPDGSPADPGAQGPLEERDSRADWDALTEGRDPT